MDIGQLLINAGDEWEHFTKGPLPSVFVGNATCGRSAGSVEVLEKFRSETLRNSISCNIVEVGCIGMCYIEPVVGIYKQGYPTIIYGMVGPKEAEQIVNKFLLNDEFCNHNILGSIGEKTIPGIEPLFSSPALRPQIRLVLQNCGLIDPTNLNHYLSNKGYSGLKKVLSLTPLQTIEEVKLSGLRGRGGAGFPTFRKWQFCHDAPGDKKYLVCNADEGDPGAFMNRSLIEGDPHSLLEGMIIAGYAIGSDTGYI